MPTACPICGLEIDANAWECVHCNARKGYSMSRRGPTGILSTVLFGLQTGFTGAVFLMLGIVFHRTWLWVIAVLLLLGPALAMFNLIKGPDWYPYEKSWDNQPGSLLLPWWWPRSNDDD